MAEPQHPPRALEGIKVVELSNLETMPNFSAAMAGKAFADHGAEVIKIEPPKAGAPERLRGPFKDELPDPETGGLHLYLNTNKLGVTLNLEAEKGRDLFFELLGSADILLNPNMPTLNERLGIGWRAMVERFSRLIAVSITTFGAESKYRDVRGGDLIATQMGGVGWETPVNQVTDFATQPPLKPAEHQADYLAGFTAAAAAMCALFQRKRTGKGQHVDTSSWLAMVSMFRPAVGIHSHEAANAPYGVRIRTRAKLGVPWVYPCKDGWVSFSPITDRFWRGTKAAMGNPEWAESELFESLISRATNHDAVEASLIDWLSNENKQEVFKKAQAEHVPCFPVNTPREVAENEQYKARGFFVEHDHPAARVVRMPGAPCMFSRTPWQLRRGAPRLGEHNREILGERLGVSIDELAALKRDGVI
ncbi:MAG TPA: CoA transferase [Candidatus Binataceae bacterium]|nr:CoA transferase [Candidatus Binataceae bacterium]